MKKKLKFSRRYVVRGKGVDTIYEPGKVYEIEGEASIKRWIKRGCEIVEDGKAEAKKPAPKKEDKVEEKKPAAKKPAKKEDK